MFTDIRSKFYKFIANPSRIYDFLFIVILLYSFLLRIDYLGETFRYWDSYRDYLIGHRIVQDNELPAVGPANGTFRFFSSPVYYYLIALILSIHDSILFLDFTNIILHTLAIAAVYLIAKSLFSPLTGILAVILYSSSRVVLQESFFVFQPFFAQPFLHIGFLLMVLSYLKKKYFLLVFGNIVVVVASAIYTSIVSVLPLMFLSSLLIIRRNKWGIKHIIFLILSIIILLEFLYLPPIVYLNKNGSNLIQVAAQSFQGNHESFFDRGIKVINVLTNFNANGLYASNTNSFLFNQLHTNLLFLVIFVVTIYYLTSSRRIENKVCLLINIGLILSTIIFATVSSYVQARHFFIILGPLCILIAEVVKSLPNKSFIFLFFKVIIIFLLIRNFSINPTEFIVNFSTSRTPNDIQQITTSIQKEVLDIKQKEELTNFHFFDIFVYPEIAAINGYSNAAFWIDLEKSLKVKFTVLDESKFGFGYRTVNENTYKFVICNYYILGDKLDDCLKSFMVEYNNYDLVKEVYDRDFFKVYLVKRGIRI